MSNGTSRWDNGLSGSARRIAETDHSPLRVLAGPGTGKTFALMRRVMRLLQGGTDPRRLFVCTFTRTAARDLETELRRLGVPGADQVKTGTVHGFCFSLLSRAEVLPLTGRVPRPILKFEERFLLEDLRGVNGEGIRDLGKRLNAFAADWARLQSETPGWPLDPMDQNFLNALSAWLRFHGAMLVGELVPEALRFLRENPASQHRPAFDHVLVDEYQDLNRAEQVLLDELSTSSAITVIGDEDQSIYSFKHAHPEGIAQFNLEHAHTHDESLSECRRCPRLIVAMANELIVQNHTRTGRALLPYAANPLGEVFVAQWPTINDETEGLASFIRHRIQTGMVAAGRVLVLAPRRQIGYAIRDFLNSTGVPAHSFFYEESLEGNPCKSAECEAQEAFSLLTICVRQDDRVALRCWCGFGSPSLNRGAWAHVRSHSATTGMSPRAVLEQLASGTLTLSGTSPVVARYRQLRQRLAVIEGLRGRPLLDAVFPASETWAAPIRDIAATFEEDGSPFSLLEAIQRGITQPELPTDVDYVRVMSLHKSKGLTADLVVVCGCIEGFIPTLPSDASGVETQRVLEEQRRLFYVAITRARQTLLLSSSAQLPRADAHRMRAQVRGRDPEHAPAVPSRFLLELGPRRPRTVTGQSIL